MHKCMSNTNVEVFYDYSDNCIAQRGTAQRGTAQHGTAQHSTAQHSTAQHGTAQHSMAPSHLASQGKDDKTDIMLQEL